MESAVILDVLPRNTALVVAAATFTVAGTVKRGSLLDILTTAPPAGATEVRVTVQALNALDPTVAGLQATEVTAEEGAAGTRLTVAFAEVAL